MPFTKISISIVIIISALVFSTNSTEKETKASVNLHHSNIDSLISYIKTNGWKDEYISECRFQIINADNKSTADLEIIFSSLPNSPQKSFVTALF